MTFTPSRIPGAWIIDVSAVHDDRGFFAMTWLPGEFTRRGLDPSLAQCNLAWNHKRGTLRGMHFQRAPHAEMKLVRCLKGKVWDVAVDLRAGSPTLLQWHAEELTPDNARMLVIAEGCAHGFQALEADSELLYLHTAFYAPEAEGGVCCDDPRLGITWPLPVTDLSERDRRHPPLPPGFSGINV